MRLVEASSRTPDARPAGPSHEREIQQILKQTERAFRMFLWCWLVVGALLLLAIFLS